MAGAADAGEGGMSGSIWRHASRAPSFLGIPCMAYMPIFLWLFHIRRETFLVSCAVILFFAVLAKFGLSFGTLWGRTLHLFRGPRIYARPWRYRHRFEDRE
jgi:intracellular multiplication protein IcmT